MYQIIGIVVPIISILLTFRYISNGGAYRKSVLTVCAIAVFYGCFLFLSDRIVEFSMGNIGAFKTVLKQATIDAKQVGEIKSRVEAQSATIDMVAKNASESKELSEGLATKLNLAEKRLRDAEALYGNLAQNQELAAARLKEISDAVNQANSALSEIQAALGFTNTITAAQTGNRKAFDQLKVWSEDRSYKFSTQALQAVNTIFEQHSQPFFRSGLQVPWKEGVDPSQLNVQQLEQNYNNAPSFLKPALIEYIAKRSDITKKDRMQFLINVIGHDEDLGAVEYAGRYFTQAANLQIKPLATEYLLEWWRDNKDKIE